MENDFSKSPLNQLFRSMHYPVKLTYTVLKVPKKFTKKYPLGYQSFTSSAARSSTLTRCFFILKMVGVRVPMGTRKPTTYLNDNSSLKIFNPIYFNQSPFLNNIPPINTRTPKTKDKIFGPVQ